jgi:plastocyanin
MTTTQPTAAGTDAQGRPPLPEPTDRATQRWVPVQRGVAVVVVAVCAVLQGVVAGAVIPPVFGLMLVFALAAAASLRYRRGAGIAIGVLGVLSLLAFLPDIVRDVRDPASLVTFSVTMSITLAVIVGIAGGAMLLRRSEGGRAPALVPAAAVAVFGVLLLVGVAARVSLESDAVQPGDQVVVAANVLFEPAEIDLTAGRAGVHITNDDFSVHNFTIEELGVALHLPERAAKRVEIEASPGTYVASCTIPGHERMVVTLTVR